MQPQRTQKMDREEINKLSNKIIGLAIDVHKELGPGFIERIYEKALAYEFRKENIKFAEQKEIRVKYKNIALGHQRVDFLVDDDVIVELKSVSEINEIHEAQMLSYLKTTNKKLGLILNFAKKKLEIKRLVNKL